MSSKGRWSHDLIPKVDEWINRKHGDVSFRLTQVLSGHGYFPAYLHRFGKLDLLNCWYCDHPCDDAYHTLFECDAWSSRSTRVNTLLQTVLAPTNMVPLMLQSNEYLNIINSFIFEIVFKKEEEERRRQAEGRLRQATTLTYRRYFLPS